VRGNRSVAASKTLPSISTSFTARMFDSTSAITKRPVISRRYGEVPLLNDGMRSLAGRVTGR
jgi:hypothetical protein